MLTDFQKQKLTRMFNRHDADHNGLIEAADYERFTQDFARIRGWQPGNTDYEAFHTHALGSWADLQQAADANHDQRVTLDEYLAYMDKMLATPAMYQKIIQETVDMIVNMMDLDGDGVITLKDHKMSYQAMGIPESVAEAAFRRFDQNGDGKLSFEELSSLTKEFYFSNDPNAAGNWLIGMG